MAARLNALTIKNFRSIRGQVVIPLDAQVVLIHGTNGMGKTSVLSALELALTGRIAHLAAHGEAYKDYLVNLGQPSGEIRLTTTQALGTDPRMQGSVTFTDKSFDDKPLLDEVTARFFGERCYLPQATLGRLLEIYNDKKTSTNSPLTQFVKEILGLDPLDALVEGLNPAGHVTRIRNLAPEYRRLEALQGAQTKDVDRATQALAACRGKAMTDSASCRAQLADLKFEVKDLDTVEQVLAVRQTLEASQTEQDVLAGLERSRAGLKAAADGWRSLPAADAGRQQADRDREAQTVADDLAIWRETFGETLNAILDGLRPTFPNLPEIDAGPDVARATALDRASAEQARCEAIRTKAEEAARRREALHRTIESSNVRLGEIDKALTDAAKATKSLASVLAAIVPYVDGDNCPVCDRNFTEMHRGALSAHVAAKIADLTSEAGRLQALAVERSEVAGRLSNAQRDVLAADRDILAPDQQAALINRISHISAAVEQLKPLETEALRGSALMQRGAAARSAAATARRASELSNSVFPELDRFVTAILAKPLASHESVDAAILAAQAELQARITLAERAISTRVTALTALAQYEQSLSTLREAATTLQDAITNQARTQTAMAEAGKVRENAKALSDAAQRVRSTIVKRVFNTSLNRTWRDLFVRLAPLEDFVPKFKIPEGDKDRVEAVLETEHRSGMASGTPGAMLSQGNLNTAALTLFLALHLSVPQRTPWLVLDDPVQSMDDLHIAQFAALLRSFSKGTGRQVVIAVHERALFDYLTLELSPAFPGDSLITVEIYRNFEGQTVAKPVAHSFENDKVVAA